jgi:hypothetical protein
VGMVDTFPIETSRITVQVRGKGITCPIKRKSCYS